MKNKIVKSSVIYFLTLILALGTVLLTATSCSEKKESYTVLMKSDNYPYSYLNNKEIAGLEADIINAAAKAQGFDITLTADENSNYNCCSSDFTDGSDSYDYTDTFYQRAIIFATAQSSGITSYEELINMKVGVIKDSAGEKFASEIASQYNLTVKEYTSRDKMYSDTEKDKIAGCFDDELIIKDNIKKGEKLKTFKNAEKATNLSFAVNKGKNRNFISDFNAGLQSIINSGEYDKIIAKW